MIGLAWSRGPTGLVAGFLLTVLAVLLWRLADGPTGYLRDASAGVLVALYVPMLAGFAALMLVPDDGGARVVAFIVTVVCSDVGGFAAGVLFGKQPMAPSISPKKSWEGMAGSVAACMLAGVLLIGLMLDGPWWGGLSSVPRSPSPRPSATSGSRSSSGTSGSRTWATCCPVTAG